MTGIAVATIATLGGVNVSLGTMNATGFSLRPAACSCIISIKSDGSVVKIINGTETELFKWITPQVGMSAYEARFTVTSGALTGGNVNTWEALSSNRSYTVVKPGTSSGTLFCNGLIEIRRGSLILASGDAIISATAEN